MLESDGQGQTLRSASTKIIWGSMDPCWHTWLQLSYSGVGDADRMGGGCSGPLRTGKTR